MNSITFCEQDRLYLLNMASSGGSRIFQTEGGGASLGKKPIIWQFFAENCMKMKEIELRGGALAP